MKRRGFMMPLGGVSVTQPLSARTQQAMPSSATKDFGAAGEGLTVGAEAYAK
jgi:hypothetical protein